MPNSAAAIKRHRYTATFGSVVIAPLAGAPEIRTDRRVVESTVCERGGGERVVSHLVKDCATVTVKTKDIATALTLLSGFSLGDDIMAEERKFPLAFTALAENEKDLVFPAAYLQPDASYIPAAGRDHVAVLVFKAFPGGERGKLFVFA